MRTALLGCLVLLANGCVTYTADDNDAFLKLFGNTLVDQANSSGAKSSSPRAAHSDTLAPLSTTQINQSYPCPSGGNMAIAGDFTVNANTSGDAYAGLGLMMTMTNCADVVDGTELTVQGDYDLTLTGSATVTGGYTSGWSFTMAGGYNVYSGSDLIQHCSVNASITNQGWSGTWCGYAVN